MGVVLGTRIVHPFQAERLPGMTADRIAAGQSHSLRCRQGCEVALKRLKKSCRIDRGRQSQVRRQDFPRSPAD